MFQTSPLSYTQEDLIQTISPLVPLNPNACPRFSLQMASLGRTSSDTSKYSYKRAVNKPLLQRKPREERDRRRQAFLDKVRRVSADKKWESRSEQILREEYFLRQKEWELHQTRSAPEASQVLLYDECEAESTSIKQVEMVDKFLLLDNQELEALVSSVQDTADQEHHQQTTFSDYGSDEEEYNGLFVELISSQESAERSTSTVGDESRNQDQEMDISVG